MRFHKALPLVLGLTLAACGSSSSSPSGTSTGSGGGGGGSSGAECTKPADVACSDQAILAMNLQPDVTKALITSSADGSGWKSNIDATAGGAFATKPDSYTYGKFTDTGLVKVDISDEDSLTSMAWDIAFRRYVVRINSGNSGPSCVKGARVPGDVKYEDVTAEPDKLVFHADQYFSKSCELIPDGSGLDSPATALSSFWTYPGCVQMTHNVFVVSLADGQKVKLTVDDFYSPAVQDECDSTGAVTESNTGSANFVVRWAFLK